MKFTKNKTGELDLGAFYAPKTQLDAQGRRILWGWIQEKRSEAEMKKAGMVGNDGTAAGDESGQDGTLRVKVLPQVVALRAGIVEGSEGVRTLAGASGEMMCSGAKGKSYELTLGHGETEVLKVSYSGETHSFMTDGKQIALQPGDVPTLHAYVDGSAIELIAGERTGYTKRFYYADATAPDMKAMVQGEGVKLNAWKIAAISAGQVDYLERDQAGWGSRSVHCVRERRDVWGIWQ